MKKDYDSPKVLLFVINMQDILTTSPTSGQGDNDLGEGDWKSLKPELEEIKNLRKF